MPVPTGVPPTGQEYAARMGSPNLGDPPARRCGQPHPGPLPLRARTTPAPGAPHRRRRAVCWPPLRSFAAYRLSGHRSRRLWLSQHICISSNDFLVYLGREVGGVVERCSLANSYDPRASAGARRSPHPSFSQPGRGWSGPGLVQHYSLPGCGAVLEATLSQPSNDKQSPPNMVNSTLQASHLEVETSPRR
jgi:hypothetical protein